MFELTDKKDVSIVETLSSKGYSPALAAKCLKEGKYSKVVEICKDSLSEQPNLLSIRLIYARALYYAGQIESATEQFYRVLSFDSENLVALKYLGDIMFASNDEVGAMANYQKILEIDPNCRAVCSSLKTHKKETTRTITFKRSLVVSSKESVPASLRTIHFYTETMGDLYLAQGFPGLAAEVYATLIKTNQNPRLDEKLLKAKEKIKEKEISYVKKSD